MKSTKITEKQVMNFQYLPHTPLKDFKAEIFSDTILTSKLLAGMLRQSIKVAVENQTAQMVNSVV